jgi:hypothetical protein
MAPEAPRQVAMRPGPDMAVDQFDVVDIVSINRSDGQVVLTISDHLDWSDSVEHQIILQRKFNAYLAFVESGEIFDSYPNSQGRLVEFRVVFKFRPDAEGIEFLNRARLVIESAGFSLRYELFAESYDN